MKCEKEVISEYPTDSILLYLSSVKLSLSIEQIAQGLDLPVEFLQQTVSQLQDESNSSSEPNDDSQSSSRSSIRLIQN